MPMWLVDRGSGGGGHGGVTAAKAPGKTGLNAASDTRPDCTNFSGLGTATRFYEQSIYMSMVAAFKFDDLVSACITPGQPNCTHGSFSAGVDKAHHLN